MSNDAITYTLEFSEIQCKKCGCKHKLPNSRMSSGYFIALHLAVCYGDKFSMIRTPVKHLVDNETGEK